MKTIQINEIEGFQIGSAQDTENATGCTVILCKEGTMEMEVIMAQISIRINPMTPGTKL